MSDDRFAEARADGSSARLWQQRRNVERGANPIDSLPHARGNLGAAGSPFKAEGDALTRKDEASSGLPSASRALRQEMLNEERPAERRSCRDRDPRGDETWVDEFNDRQKET